MKIYATTLNVFGEHVHPVATLLCKIWDTMGLARSSGSATADVILVNGPGAPPYKFDQARAEQLAALKKPIVIVVDHEGEAKIDGVEEGWSAFVRSCDQIKVAIYREWKKSDTTMWPFALIPYDLVGYDSRHPKEHLPSAPISRHDFEVRPYHLSSFVSNHADTQSRTAFKHANFNGLSVLRHDKYEHAMLPVQRIYTMCRESKMTVALEGSGIKCNWHTELGSLAPMIMPHVEMNELFPWIDGVNCVRAIAGPGGDHGRGIVDVDKTVTKVRSVIDNADLHYSIYQQSVLNAQNYKIRTYYPVLFGELSRYV